MVKSENTNAHAAHLERNLELRNLLSCDYCGILKNRCNRSHTSKHGRNDRYKNHRRVGGR
jgi:hypothetical protein